MFWNLVGGLALLLFISIASSYNTIPLKNIDMWAADTLQGRRVLEAFHVIGNTETIVVITLIFAFILIATKKAWQAALFSVVTVALGYGLNQLLKRLFERPRPNVVDQLTSFSFPSGHSMATTICLLIIVFVAQQQFFKHAKLYAVYVIAFIVAMLVALSRVAAARHFFTDVTAGASLGVACVIAAAYMYKKVIH